MFVAQLLPLRPVLCLDISEGCGPEQAFAVDTSLCGPNGSTDLLYKGDAMLIVSHEPAAETSSPGSAARAIQFIHRHLVAVLIVIAVSTTSFVYLTRLTLGPLRDDAEGYYLYLPAIWLYHDVTLTDPRLAYPWWAIHHFPSTGHNGDVYQLGVAVLCSPLFLVGHFTAVLLQLHPNGYSVPEQVGAVLTALGMLVLGAWALRRSLSRRHSTGVVVGALVCVIFGTSVFDYAVVDSLYSHIFAFGLICALIPISEAWVESGSKRLIFLLGLVVGLLALVRLSDVIFIALPFCYLLSTSGGPKAGLHRLWAQRWAVLAVLMVAFLVYLPQLLLFRFASGYWTTNLYGGSPFDWLHPHTLQALLSFNPHGLLPWAPVLILAIPGLIVMGLRRDPWAVPLIAILTLNLYIITSWHQWSYGSGFGLRPFVDSTGLLALPLAAFFSDLKTPIARLSVLILAWILVMATVIQTIHYWHGLIAWDGISAGRYLQLLFRP